MKPDLNFIYISYPLTSMPTCKVSAETPLSWKATSLWTLFVSSSFSHLRMTKPQRIEHLETTSWATMRESPALLRALQEKTPVPVSGSDGNWPQWTHPEWPVWSFYLEIKAFFTLHLYVEAVFNTAGGGQSALLPPELALLGGWDVQSHPTKSPGSSLDEGLLCLSCTETGRGHLPSLLQGVPKTYLGFFTESHFSWLALSHKCYTEPLLKCLGLQHTWLMGPSQLCALNASQL